jgi:hypothetical protein
MASLVIAIAVVVSVAYLLYQVWVADLIDQQ